LLFTYSKHMYQTDTDNNTTDWQVERWESRILRYHLFKLINKFNVCLSATQTILQHTLHRTGTRQAVNILSQSTSSVKCATTKPRGLLACIGQTTPQAEVVDGRVAGTWNCWTQAQTTAVQPVHWLNGIMYLAYEKATGCWSCEYAYKHGAAIHRRLYSSQSSRLSDVLRRRICKHTHRH